MARSPGSAVQVLANAFPTVFAVGVLAAGALMIAFNPTPPGAPLRTPEGVASPQAVDDEAPTSGAVPGAAELVGRPAFELVIALSDLPARWRLVGEGSEVGTEAGMRDGFWREVDREISFLGYEETVRANTTARSFSSVGDAKEFFGGQLAAVKEGNKTEARRYGDQAVFWSTDGHHNFMLVRKANVVWSLGVARGNFPANWSETVEWFAGKVVERAR